MKRIKIGADPEFVYETAQGHPEAAGNYQVRTGGFGTDGRNDTAEIRPGSEGDVINLMTKIREILTLASENSRIKKLRMLGGAYVHGRPIGGHIHISHPELVYPGGRAPTRNDRLRLGYRILTTRLMGKLLDAVLYYGLGNTLEETLKGQKKGRLSAGYGMPGMIYLRVDGRHRGHGDGGEPNRVEYRTPPSWLVSPELSLVYLGLAKLCTIIYLDMREGVKNIERLRPGESGSKFEDPYDEVEKRIVGITKTIKEESNYHRRVTATSDLLEFMASLINIPEDCELAINAYNTIAPLKIDWGADIRKTWRIV